MKLALKIEIRSIHVGERLFNTIIKNNEHIEPMTDALTGDICDTSVIYKGHLVLRDDRCGDSIDDIKVDLSGLVEADDG